MLHKKFVLLMNVLTILTLLVALSACGGAATPVAEPAAEEPAATEAAAEEPAAEEPAAEATKAPAEAAPEEPAAEEQPAGEEIVLELWSPENRDADVEAMNWLIAQFEEAHPGVKVNFTLTSWEDHFTRIQAAAAGGTMPDILYTWAPATGGLYQQGLITDLNDLWAEWGADSFGPGPSLEVADGQGNYYGVPVYGYLHVLYYRTDWFQDAGLEPPDTLEDFIAAAETLTTDEHKGVQLYTRGFDSYYVMDLFTSNGVEPLDADGNITINSPQAVEVMDMIKTINDNGWTPDGWTAMNMDDAKLAFMGGSAAMLLNSTSFINTMVNDNPEALDYISIVPLPIGKGTMRGWAGNAQFSVSSQSKNVEMAKEFLRFWFTPEIYKTYMGMTVLGFMPLYLPVAQDPAFLEQERIAPIADLYVNGIKAGAEGGPILGAEHGPNVITFQAYNEMLYAQLAEKIYAGESAADVMAFAESELLRIAEENGIEAVAKPAGGAAAEEPAAEAAVEEEMPSPEGVVLELWSPENRDADVEAMNDLIAKFEAAYPGIKVNFTLTSWEDHFTRIQAAAAGGTMPDILYTWAPATGGLYQQGLVADLNDLWAKLGADSFGPGPSLEVSDGQGNYFGVPVYGYLHVLYYRTDWFKDAGLEPPDTLEDFIAAAETLTTDEHKGVQLYTRGFDSYYVMDLFTSNGVEPLNADGNITINTPEAVEVMDMIKKINDNGWTPDGWTAMNMDDAKLAFMGGSAAMLLNSTSFINTMVNDNPEALDYISIVPLPIGKGTMRGWAGNAQFSVSSQSENQEWAKKFLEFWFEPDVYADYMGNTVLGFMPLYLPVAQDPAFLEQERIAPIADLYVNGIKAGAEGGPILGAEHGPNVVTFQAYNEMLYAQLAEKVYAGESAADVMAFAESELQRIMDENQ